MSSESVISESLSTYSTTSQYFEQSRVKHFMMVFSLSLLIFVSTLSSTIVSTAQESIVKVHGVKNLTWVTQSFLLTSTALQPIWGKLSDVFGRMILYKIAIYLYMISSLAAGFSVSMEMLIVCRAFMGLGAGAIQVLSLVILSDIVPIRARGKYLGATVAAGLLGQAVGPLLGGVLTAWFSWRYTQFINIPILLIGSIMVIFLIILPNPAGSIKTKIVRIDFLGIVLVVTASSIVFMAFDILGSSYTFSSITFIVLVVVGIVIMAIFLIFEKYTKKDPIVSMRMVKHHNVWVGFLSAMTTGIVIYVTLFTVPNYFRAVYNSNTIETGLKTWPYAFGVFISTIVTGFAITRYGNFKPYLWIGGMLLIVASSLLTTLTPNEEKVKEIILFGMIGVGIGFRAPSVTIEAQSVVSNDDRASVTALINFSRNVGGVIGVAISKSIVKTNFTKSVYKLMAEHPEWDENFYLASEGIISALWKITDPVVRQKALIKYLLSLEKIIYACIIASSIGFILSLFCSPVKLRHTKAEREEYEKHIASIKSRNSTDTTGAQTV
ncbi:hypothetical protein BB559_004752 [Furculomyces boomerangus]|uniref:Major facilitator superfamily (MFS) profile domain-containing protein n=2 Tax=Harpellales TaxID=61421 RepID=A0A2T9YCY4_9FUNG|nr:hypothetical protein BB559_004752 [Furculomyces boomerangus]PVZ99251.1 hypothetical protein BB558_004741 [Smittium angustum]